MIICGKRDDEIMWERIKRMVLPEVKFQPAFVGFLYLFACFQGALHLSSVFINLFLMSGQGDSMVSVCLYNGLNFLFTPIGFFISGILSKKTNMALQIRISMISLSCIYLLLILLGERAVAFSALLGMLNGFAAGFYYLAHISLINQLNDRYTVDAGLNSTSLIAAVEGITLPMVAGTVIHQIPGIRGYLLVFTGSLMLMLGAFAFSFRLPGGRNSQPYRLGPVFRMYRHQKCWRRMAALDFLRGTREGGLAFLISILLFISVRNELFISVNSTMCSLTSILLFGFVLKRIMADNRLTYYHYAALGGLVGSCLLFANQGPVILFLFSLLNTVAVNLTGNTSTALEYEAINQWDEVSDYRQEALAVRESFVNAGRVVSVSVLIILEVHGVWNSFTVACYITAIYLIQYLLFFLLRKIQSEVNRLEKERMGV